MTRHNLAPALLLAAGLVLAVLAWLPRPAPVDAAPARAPLRPLPRLHAVAGLPPAPAAPRRVRRSRPHPARHARTLPRRTVAPRAVATAVVTAAPTAVPIATATATATARPVATPPPAPVATVAAPRSTSAPQFDSSGGFDSSG